MIREKDLKEKLSSIMRNPLVSLSTSLANQIKDFRPTWSKLKVSFREKTNFSMPKVFSMLERDNKNFFWMFNINLFRKCICFLSHIDG